MDRINLVFDFILNANDNTIQVLLWKIIFPVATICSYFLKNILLISSFFPRISR